MGVVLKSKEVFYMIKIETSFVEKVPKSPQSGDLVMFGDGQIRYLLKMLTAEGNDLYMAIDLELGVTGMKSKLGFKELLSQYGSYNVVTNSTLTIEEVE
jgi:hypothetical protein